MVAAKVAMVASAVWGALLVSAAALAGPCEWPQICPGTFPTGMQQTYMMNKSTIIMACNYTGFIDPARTAGWGIIDYDWTNNAGFGQADGWAKHTPMDTDEMLFRQVQMTKEASPETHVWIYRNAIYGYAWFAPVRKLLDDPAYHDWFLPFKPEGPYYSPKCDKNFDPPKCTDLYHAQLDAPLPVPDPRGWGNCLGKACDCGTQPCGFYVFNHSTRTVVRNQTFRDWFIHSYVLNEIGASPLVGGFFWDDQWDENCFLHDQSPKTCEDMGLTKAEMSQLTRDWGSNMQALREATLGAGKFSWQMLWTGGDPLGYGDTGPHPIVKRKSCAADLRDLCRAASPAQNRAMMYQFTGIPEELPGFEQDLANFLLIRGPYAWLGHAWQMCNHMYKFPPELHMDYGEPIGLCSETAPGSGVFSREWTKASVEMDCNQWRPKIQLKQQQPPPPPPEGVASTAAYVV